MGHALADWVEEKLLGMEDHIVPVKRLWNVHCEENEVPQTTPDELAEILKSDPRFYYVEEQREDREDTEEETLRLEKMGFFKGPKVMLQGRIPSKQELIDGIARNIDTMMLNLRKAYEIRPKDSEQTEDELIDVMLKADQLKKEILRAMADETTDIDDMANQAQAEGEVNQD